MLDKSKNIYYNHTRNAFYNAIRKNSTGEVSSKMNEMIILGNNARQVVETLLNGGFVVKEATVRYYPNIGRFKKHSTALYPLTITCKLGNRKIYLRIYEVTAGTDTKKSRDMVDILKVCDVDFQESDILTDKFMNDKGLIEVTFYKREKQEKKEPC